MRNSRIAEFARRFQWYFGSTGIEANCLITMLRVIIVATDKTFNHRNQSAPESQFPQFLHGRTILSSRFSSPAFRVYFHATLFATLRARKRATRDPISRRTFETFRYLNMYAVVCIVSAGSRVSARFNRSSAKRLDRAFSVSIQNLSDAFLFSQKEIVTLCTRQASLSCRLI